VAIIVNVIIAAPRFRLLANSFWMINNDHCCVELCLFFALSPKTVCAFVFFLTRVSNLPCIDDLLRCGVWFVYENVIRIKQPDFMGSFISHPGFPQVMIEWRKTIWCGFWMDIQLIRILTGSATCLLLPRANLFAACCDHCASLFYLKFKKRVVFKSFCLLVTP
jgi:hypothetical protein